MNRCSFLSLLLAALIAVTATGFGVARGQLPAGGQMVLCIGGAAVTVTLDARGNPVEQTHLCPEAAGGLLLATALPPIQSQPPVRLSALAHAVPAALPVPFRSYSRPSARAPPESV